MTEPDTRSGDLAALVALGVVAANAYASLHLPGLLNVVAVAALIGSATRIARPRAAVLLVAGVVLLTGQHSAWSSAALRTPLEANVDGIATLVSDPEVRDFDTQVILQIEGRRYQASIPIVLSAPLRSMLSGEKVTVAGTTAVLKNAPAGWVKSWHLAGRLKVTKIEAVAGVAPWYRIANSLRRTIQAGAGSLERDRAGLYMGLVVGDDRGQSELLRFRFGASGLTHLLAVSGQNVAFLLSVADPLLSRMGSRARLLAVAALLIVFTLVTRGEPSVLRAVVMSGVAMTAVTTGRTATGIRVLSVTAILLLLVDPLLVHSVGFQLSVSATLGLLVLARPIEARLPGPRFVALPLAVTLAAQIATAPLLLWLSGGIPTAAVPANLLAGPPAGIVMMLGVTAGLLAGLVREPIAGVMMIPVDLLVRWIEWVADVSSRLPLAVLGLGGLVVAGAGVAMLLLGPERRRGRLVSVLGLSFVVLACWPTDPPKGATELADGATLWVGACGGRVLVLTGGARTSRTMEALWRVEARHVDLLVVDGGRAVARLAVPLSQQFGVRRVASSRSPAPASAQSLAESTIRVGDLIVDLRSPPSKGPGPRPVSGAKLVRVESSGGECKF